MSLLIDALRKAEKDRENAPAGRSETAALTLEPMPTRRAGAAPVSAAPVSDERTQREAATNLFAVKGDAPRLSGLGWLAALGVLAGLAIAAWVWWQMQPRGLAVPGAFPPARLTLSPDAAPRAYADTAVDDSPEPATLAPAPRASTPITSPAQTVNIRRVQRGELGAPTPQRAAPAPRPAEPAGPRLRRTAPPSDQVPAMLTAAYADYRAGRLSNAEHRYRDYLRTDANNTDALNGLGAIALQRGQSAVAARWFRRTLVAAPDNTVAQTGLASLAPADDAVVDEAQLRELAAQQPASGEVSFALGNSLARQRRWAEAQQAYFEALTRDAANPDYLFNLAVSLDHLQQTDLAVGYYSRALDAAGARRAVFDPAPVRARLQALTAGAPEGAQ